MKKALILICIIAAFKLNAQQLNIIPLPNKINIGNGYLRLNNSVFVLQCNTEPISQLFPHNPLEQLAKGNKKIDVHIQLNNAEKDQYQMIIEKDSITISGNATACYNALQSLAQLAQHQDSIPCCRIGDWPRFEYRGMHLDVCRHFFTVAEVKQYIDLLARYKFNYFHWHLTDDQGWRIQIKQYPLLTQIGSTRKQSLVGKQTINEPTGPFDNKIVEGFYTQDQIKDVVQYAQDRKITIVPEIEMPGHALAAIASYPWLGCKKKPTQVGNRWGVYDDVFCAGNDSTLQFMQDVLREVIALFPGKYVHIGGDEVVKKNWKTCSKCQARIKENGLQNEVQLQSFFIGRINKYLTSLGKTAIGWDEILEGGVAPNATIMSWRGELGGIDAARQEHNVIMTPNTYCYFDYCANHSQDEPLNIGGHLPLQKVYAYNPMPAELREEQQKYILGAQANLWTEYITDWDKLCYMAMPRMQALSEVLWTNMDFKDYKQFTNRLDKDLQQLEKIKIN
jgi:hexosaminidase